MLIDKLVFAFHFVKAVLLHAKRTRQFLLSLIIHFCRYEPSIDINSVPVELLTQPSGFPQRLENLEIQENENGHGKVMEHIKMAKVMEFCN